MSLATYGITRERETHTAELLRHYWPVLRLSHPSQRLYYAVGTLVCDQQGLIERTVLVAAIGDEAVAARACALLTIVRYERDDGGWWPDG